MAILVLDSSVLIDLERGGLFEAFFQLQYTFVVTDILYEFELREYNGPYLQGLGLGITTLDAVELQLVQGVQLAMPVLSQVDCSALANATRHDHVLLSGDGALRAEAGRRNVRCNGLLWVLDQLEAAGLATAQRLCEALSLISNHARCRLLRHEIDLRLARWCNAN